MNKFIKISLIVAAVLLGVGLLFSAIGLFGAKREIKRLIKEEVITQEKIQKVTDLLNGEGLSLDISDQDKVNRKLEQLVKSKIITIEPIAIGIKFSSKYYLLSASVNFLFFENTGKKLLKDDKK